MMCLMSSRRRSKFDLELKTMNCSVSLDAAPFFVGTLVDVEST